MSVAAIIVTYFPQASLLSRVLAGVSAQVDRIYVIDNTPSSSVPEESLIWLNQSWLESFGCAIEYHALGENQGIASAQNIGIRYALASSYQELIFFDQDSYPPNNLVSALLSTRNEIEKKGIRLGAIGPRIKDTKSNLFIPIVQAGFFWVGRAANSSQNSEPIRAEYVISSGSLISSSALKHVGYMFEPLFIDWVDVEWSLRAQAHGLVHYVLPTVVMDHSIGDDHIQIGSKVIYRHSNLRNFYSVRNAAYLALHGHFKFAWHLMLFVKIPAYILYFSYTSSGSRWRTFKVLLKAAYFGFRGKLGAAPNNLFS
jgi:rhamnosyltransferase